MLNEVKHNHIGNSQKAMAVNVFDAIYLSGLYGSCLGSAKGSGRGRFVCRAALAIDASSDRKNSKQRPTGDAMRERGM